MLLTGGRCFRQKPANETALEEVEQQILPLPSGNLRPGSPAGVALVYSQDKSEEVGPSQPYPSPISRTSCYWRVKSHANRERDKLQIVRHKGNKEKSSS